MRFYLAVFALLAAMVAGCAVSLALLVGGGPPSLDGEDEGPPQVFHDIAQAEKVAGYRIPYARDLPTWRLATITVVPANSGRKELRDAGYGILAGEGPSDIEKQLGVHSYVHLQYEQGPGREVTVTMNLLPPERSPQATPPRGVVYTTETIIAADTSITIETVKFREGAGTTVSASWRKDGVPFAALSILRLPDYHVPTGVSKDELLELIAAIR